MTWRIFFDELQVWVAPAERGIWLVDGGLQVSFSHSRVRETRMKLKFPQFLLHLCVFGIGSQLFILLCFSPPLTTSDRTHIHNDPYLKFYGKNSSCDCQHYTVKTMVGFTWVNLKFMVKPDLIYILHLK